MRGLVFASILVAVSIPANAEPASHAHTITVSGEASMYVDPDHASVDLGVVTEASTVSAALALNNGKMSAVIASLRTAGVKNSEVQTSTFSINPVNARLANGAIDYNHYDGYSVTNKLTVTVSDLTKVGSIIDAAANAGANSSNSIVFQVENREAYLDKVRAAAVRNARHKAQVLAGADGQQVGPMITIGNNISTMEYESAPPPPPPPPPPSPGTSILPGQLEISANVTVVFALK